MRKILFLILSGSILLGEGSSAQKYTMTYTLEEIIELAREQSPMAIMARHRFRGSYWEFRTYKAKFRPSLDLNSVLPELTRSIDKITLPDGSDDFVERKLINSSMNLNLTQNISLTGGTVFMNSDLERIDLLGDDPSSKYMSTPVSIGFRQPIRAHNTFKWDKKIEPLKYEEARKEYLDAMEMVSQRAGNYFFDLALAQVNIEISRVNYSNNDTLYKIAQGRYNIGTIAENELLQMELSLLNAGTALNEARIDLEMRKFQLRSFLGYNENVDIELTISPDIPDFEVDVGRALVKARENNPEVINLQRQLLEAERDVSMARAEKGLTANLFASYGLTRRAAEFRDVFRIPQDQQRIRVGLEIPIVDWGLGKGQYRMARSSQEVIRTNVRQAQTDFEQEVMLQVMQFNLQDDQLKIAGKADTIAQNRYNVTKQRFLIGKIDVLDLNVALSEKDAAKRGFLSALRNYWSYYYNIRRLTLYDFEQDNPIPADFEELVE